jgi:hypothetical protein
MIVTQTESSMEDGWKNTYHCASSGITHYHHISFL